MYFYVFLCTKLAWPFVLVNYMDLLSFLDFMLSTARIDVRDAMKPGLHIILFLINGSNVKTSGNQYVHVNIDDFAGRRSI